MEICRRSSWLLPLLGVILLAVALQGVQGEVETEGPSETECRPYIEKALRELEHGAGDADVGQSNEEASSVDNISIDENQSDEQRSSEESVNETETEQESQEKDPDTDNEGEKVEETDSKTDDSNESDDKEAQQNLEEENKGSSETESGETTQETKSSEDDTVEKDQDTASDEEAQQDEAAKDSSDSVETVEVTGEEPSADAQASSEIEEQVQTSSSETLDAAPESSTETTESTQDQSKEDSKEDQSIEKAPTPDETDDDTSKQGESDETKEKEGDQSDENQSTPDNESADSNADSKEKDVSADASKEDDSQKTASDETDKQDDDEQKSGESVEEQDKEQSKDDDDDDSGRSKRSAEESDEKTEAESEKEGGDSIESAETTNKESAEDSADTGNEVNKSIESAEDKQDETPDSGKDSTEGESKEGDSKEEDTKGDSKEGDSKEGDSKEGDSKEGDTKDGDSKEGDSKEGDSKEGDTKEDSKEGDSKEGDSKEVDSKEGDSKEGAKEDSKEEASKEADKDDSKDDDSKADQDSKESSVKEDDKDDSEQKDTNESSQEDSQNKESSEGDSDEDAPEEDLIIETDIPKDLRPREHVDHLLKLDREATKTEEIIDRISEITLRELKRLYENAIKPLETLYKYRDLSNRHYGDAEIFSKPLILFMGPWSGGKSSIINYLLDVEYNDTALRTGAEPSPAHFNLLMYGEEEEVLDGTQLAADYTFSGLQKFGQGLEERLRGVKLKSKLLEKMNIVEIPGILEVRKQVSRVFPFNDACQWFIDRADIIFLVYDPSKLDVGPETEAILDQLKGREYQTRIILNKADQVKPEELMRVQGALIWNISPLMSSPQPPIMYTTSLWSRPYEHWAPVRLLQAQERSFLRDLRSAVDKRIENKIASARRFAVRVRNHAKMVDCYLTTYYNHKSIFGNRKLVSDAIIEHPQDYHIYEGLSTLTNISRYDLPDPDVYKDFFRLNPLYEFQQLSATCTYFRGCPINKLDVAIAYDLPELVGKHKRLVETALAESNQDQTQGS